MAGAPGATGRCPSASVLPAGATRSPSLATSGTSAMSASSSRLATSAGAAEAAAASALAAGITCSRLAAGAAAGEFSPFAPIEGRAAFAVPADCGAVGLNEGLGTGAPSGARPGGALAVAGDATAAGWAPWIGPGCGRPRAVVTAGLGGGAAPARLPTAAEGSIGLD